MKDDNLQPVSDLDRLLDGIAQDEAAGLREMWTLTGASDPTPAPGPEACRQALHTFEAVMAHEVPATARRTDRPAQHRARRRSRVRVWAAGLATVFIVGVGLAAWFSPVTRTAPPGERLAFTLPDGSQVELNSGARLRYARHFGTTRRVHLHGEAFFAVQPAVQPFVVETFNAEVRVLGTRFGVRAWGGSEDETTVALEEGRVTLAPLGRPEQAVTLAPGETHRVRDGGGIRTLAPREAVSAEEATAWRRGDFVFIDQPLGAILDDVERRFAVEVQVQPPALLAERLEGRIRQPADAEAVLRDLARVLALRYRATSNGYMLYAESL